MAVIDRAPWSKSRVTANYPYNSHMEKSRLEAFSDVVFAIDLAPNPSTLRAHVQMERGVLSA